MLMFTVRDRKAGTFNRPFFELNKVQALRAFSTACKQAESPFSQFPDDFELLYLGTFDQRTGRISMVEHFEVLAEPRSFVEPDTSAVMKARVAKMNEELKAAN